MGSPPGLWALANELLIMIATSTSSNQLILDHKDLASLALVNRQLHTIANPLLYDFNEKYQHFSSVKIATENGNLHTLKVAAKLGKDLHFRDKNGDRSGNSSVLFHGEHLLGLACTFNRPEIVAWLLDRGAVLEQTDECGPFGREVDHYHSTLIIAFKANAEDLFLLLLSRGANWRVFQGSRIIRDDILCMPFLTALHLAALNGMLRAVEFLVKEMNVPVNIRDSSGATPLVWVVQKECPHNRRDLDMLKKLMELGADIDMEYRGLLPLTEALSHRHYTCANMLLDAGSKLKPSNPMHDKPYPIHACAGIWYPPHVLDLHHIPILQRLVAAGADLEERYVHGNTPLEEAILKGKSETVLELLALGADIDARTMRGNSVLETLINSDISWRYRRSPEMNPMLVDLRRKAVVLFKGGVKDDIQHTKPYSFLSWIVRKGEVGLLEELLTIATPASCHLDLLLAQSMDSGNIGACEILDRHGAVLRDAKKAYAFAKHSLAPSNGDFSASDIYKGRWFNMALTFISVKETSRLVSRALAAQDEIHTHFLLDHIGHIHSSHKPKWIFQAAAWGNVTIIDRLMRLSMDVNWLYWKSRRTPLAEAVRRGNFDASRALLGYGADPFLPRNQPSHTTGWENTTDEEATSDGEHWYCKSTRRMPGLSAFEIAIQRDKNLDLVKDMWQKTNPKDRPNPNVFALRTPKKSHEIAKWLQEVTVANNLDDAPVDSDNKKLSVYESESDCESEMTDLIHYLSVKEFHP
ncbi:ankyrin repeat-containing domain protein [Hypoxylon fuscum]|nr:ankyrin repeat-containing domain protein [Hypoxylon fuscum]